MTRAIALLAALLPLSAHAQKIAGPKPEGAPPAPVLLDHEGLFQDRLAQVGDDVFIAGQPTERGLREMRGKGVTVVVNLRSAPEMKRVGFDEEKLAASLGLKYVWLPMRGTSEFTPKALQAFAAAMKEADGKVLLHCTVAWRASHLWAAYLIQERHVADATAVQHGRVVNLMDDHRMTDDGKQPLELFLGRAVAGLGHP